MDEGSRSADAASSVVTLCSMSQGASGERKGSGSAAGTAESGQREGEEGAGGEAKGAGGKEETGRKAEGVSAPPPGWAAAAAPVQSGSKKVVVTQEEAQRLAAEQRAAKEREAAAKQREAAAKQVNPVVVVVEPRRSSSLRTKPLCLLPQAAPALNVTVDIEVRKLKSGFLKGFVVSVSTDGLLSASPPSRSAPS